MPPERRQRAEERPRPVAPALVFLAVMGPGLITASVDNDAGGITTYSARRRPVRDRSSSGRSSPSRWPSSWCRR